MTRLIILAGGEAHRWGNHLGVPKHLAPVPAPDGGVERLLCRTLRQFRLRGITDVHAIVPLDHLGYRLHGVTLHGRTQAELGCPAWVRSIPIWHPVGRTIILHGDWWLSEIAVDAIIDGGTEVARSWQYACRIGPSAITGVPYGEGAGTSCWPEHHATYERLIRHVDQLGRDRVLARTGSWELWAAMCGVPDSDLTSVLDDPRHLPHRIDLPDDGSGDFDYPRDYDAWWRAWRDGRIRDDRRA